MSDVVISSLYRYGIAYTQTSQLLYGASCGWVRELPYGGESESLGWNVGNRLDNKIDLFVQIMEKVKNRIKNAKTDRWENAFIHENEGRIKKLEEQVKELQSDFRQLVGLRK